MADANPGIGGLGAATQVTLEEYRSLPAAGSAGVVGSGAAPEPAGGTDTLPRPVSWRSGNDRPPPNLGPPPPRLDWRKRRS